MLYLPDKTVNCNNHKNDENTASIDNDKNRQHKLKLYINSKDIQIIQYMTWINTLKARTRYIIIILIKGAKYYKKSLLYNKKTFLITRLEHLFLLISTS